MPQSMIHYQDYDELVSMLKKSDQNFDMELIDKAYHLALEAHGDQRYTHSRVSTNDEGVALGQLMALEAEYVSGGTAQDS